jgi:hypothetical protein
LIRSHAGDPQKAGIKGLIIEPWFGVFVPAAAIVARLSYPLSYGNFNGMQIRACRGVPSQSGALPAASAPGQKQSRVFVKRTSAGVLTIFWSTNASRAGWKAVSMRPNSSGLTIVL